MKKLLLAVAFVVVALAAHAQNTVIVSGNITKSTTWTNTNQYILIGFVYVTKNATLTIQPGTIVKSSGGALIVTRGSKLMANGTVNQPIVFTSSKAIGQRKSGDWGGIIILGKAPINHPAGENIVEGGLDITLGLYGGTNAADKSGELNYVRIEYAGQFYLPNNELNGLTLGGVGSATKISNVQVSYGLDDSFEWFGGTVNATNLVAYNGLDDDFDTDYGFSGYVQFAMGLRDPNIADVSTSNGFESDNDPAGSTNAPKTNAKFSNVTLFGPIRTSPTNSFNSLYGRGAHLRRCTEQDIHNSVIIGYKEGVRLDGDCIVGNSTKTPPVNGSACTGDLSFRNNVLAGNITPITAFNSTGAVTTLATCGTPLLTWLTNQNTIVDPSPTYPQYRNPYASVSNPDFRLETASPVRATTLNTKQGLSASFFKKTTYLGAFDQVDWTDCWSEFRPDSANYTTQNINYSVTGASISDNTTTLVVTLPAGVKVDKWYKNNVIVKASTGKTSIKVKSTDTGTWVAKVVSERGCKADVTYTRSAKAGNEVVINNQTVLAAATVFPNPSNGVFTVNFESLNANTQTVEVRLVDMTGRLVYSELVDAQEGANQVAVEVAGLATGIYTLQLNANGQTLTEKVVIK